MGLWKFLLKRIFLVLGLESFISRNIRSFSESFFVLLFELGKILPEIQKVFCRFRFLKYKKNFLLRKYKKNFQKVPFPENIRIAFNLRAKKFHFLNKRNFFALDFFFELGLKITLVSFVLYCLYLITLFSIG